MKQFIKEWILPPSIYKSLIKYKQLTKSFFTSSSADFQKNIELKDIHTDKRCFIIGLGASINKQDLTLLKDEIVIGVSSLFNHKDLKLIQPNYYVLSPVFEYHLKYTKKENFITWLRAMDETLDDSVIMFMHIGDKKYIEEYNIFLNKKIYWDQYIAWDGGDINDISLDSIPNISSVSESALSIALYLGFKDIYMLGFDHSWYEGVYHYFDDKKVHQYFEKNQFDIKKEHNFDSEFQMRAHANIFKKYKKLYQMKYNIYNANADHNTYVDTFPKVIYENLFTK